MATAPKSATTRYNPSPAVEQFVQTALDLIRTAGGYAAGGEYNAEYDAMIRELRVVNIALGAALGAIPLFAPPPT